MHSPQRNLVWNELKLTHIHTHTHTFRHPQLQLLQPHNKFNALHQQQRLHSHFHTAGIRHAARLHHYAVWQAVSQRALLKNCSQRCLGSIAAVGRSQFPSFTVGSSCWQILSSSRRCLL
ncbi:unnamed protein product [Ceratitis capitata]|uniref:(Mediterranean fruit fly) hypothetical protein n=1 Tax=Ceratitis capitata TaxID=7213 RepID=A0A811V6W9_CERCA|nr:unnamed protein product [Ceratitis capitata]